MQNIPIYEALAQAFAAEGVETHFSLMGDGNMHCLKPGAGSRAATACDDAASQAGVMDSRPVP
jgi:hypothetical protein